MLTPHVPGRGSIGRSYGLRPSPATHPLLRAAGLHQGDSSPVPEAVDWRAMLTPVRDQGQEGSCFAHAVAALKEFNCAVWSNAAVAVGYQLSVAYLSWRTRLAEGTFPDDSGATIADAMGVLHSWGICPESFLPYNQNPAEKGNAPCDVAAQPFRCGMPSIVPLEPGSFKSVLAAKKVIVIGFMVHPSFEQTGADGVVKPVSPGEPMLGGHAVLVCGYDSRGMVVRNSWSTGWADKGYCYMPWEYLDGQIFESWTTG